MIDHNFLGKTTVALDTEPKGHQNFPITGRFITDMDSEHPAAVGVSQKGRVRLCQRFAGNGGNEQNV
jgi:hypothetical protein